MIEKFGSGRFCSRACANTRKPSTKTKQKIAEHTYHKPANYCKICGAKLSAKNSSGLCKKCYFENYPEETKQKQSIAMQGKPRWNIHRNQRSFAEKFWENVLSSRNIIFKTEVPIKHDVVHCYFLDFELEKNGKLVDLEIDGKQHLDRLDEDIKRDAFISKTHIVYRIPWNDLRSKVGKLEMQNKINKFLDFYNSL
jgi:very-short-patch-repair endonuclease